MFLVVVVNSPLCVHCVTCADVSTDPAVEQQAVARVHRIGQTRPVMVTRLLCDATVEMTILEVGVLMPV